MTTNCQCCECILSPCFVAHGASTHQYHSVPCTNNADMDVVAGNSRMRMQISSQTPGIRKRALSDSARVRKTRGESDSRSKDRTEHNWTPQSVHQAFHQESSTSNRNLSITIHIEKLLIRHISKLQYFDRLNRKIESWR